MEPNGKGSSNANLTLYLHSCHIGSTPLGGNYPVRIQSMTNTDTLDTLASVAQCIRIIEAGADYVRLTAQGIREAENLAVVKNELRKAGFTTPLIADIMTRYGNTPSGMVSSAMEFIRIFQAENFTDLVLSMKSSDTAVMIAATRMLVTMMLKEGVAYPLHLGVTEAGEGEDGRVRSAAGIGALLSEGIGDTIRVSLSEDPEYEIPVAKKIAGFYPRGSYSTESGSFINYLSPSAKPEIFKRINGPLVISDLTSSPIINEADYLETGFIVNTNTKEVSKTDCSADLIIASELPETIPDDVSLVLPYQVWSDRKDYPNLFPMFSPETFYKSSHISDKLNILHAHTNFNMKYLKKADPLTTIVLFTFDTESERYAPDNFMKSLFDNKLSVSIILNPVFNLNDPGDLRIKTAGTSRTIYNR